MGWLDIWNAIVRLFGKPVSNFPTSKGKISGEEIYTTLRQKYGNIAVYISDKEFELCSRKEARDYLDGQVKQPYIAEAHDCDNFSFAAMGYFSQGLYSFAFGIMWSGVHAFNFMFDENKELWIFEPQSNTFMTVEDALKNPIYSPLRFALL